MRTTILSLIILISSASAHAQSADADKSNSAFSHLDISLTAGSTGVGVDFSTPISSWLSVRAGASTTPRINMPSTYKLQVGDQPEKQKYDKNGNPIQTRFQKMADLMYQITGSNIDQKIRINRNPVFDNIKLLFDIHPLRNKSWHATVGFYYGSSNLFHCENDIRECTSLTGVSMYNNLHRMAMNNEPISIGNDDVYLNSTIVSYFKLYGKMGVNMGNFVNDILDEEGNIIHPKGSIFLLEPNADNLIIADGRINRFRPYIGVGYSGKMIKDNDHWRIGVECGVMSLGSHPTVTTSRKEQTTTYDSATYTYTTTSQYYEIDLTRDLTNLPSSVSHQVNLIRHLSVFPVAELRLTYRL